jgi:hypothetical protein
VCSRVRLAGLALAIRTVALGGWKAGRVGIAPAPLSFRALASRANCSEQIDLTFEHVHRQSFGECIARSAVLGFEGANEREGLRRDAQARLRPEIEGLRSDLSIRQHRQPTVAPGDPISLLEPIGSPAMCTHLARAAAASVSSPPGRRYTRRR